MVPTRVVRKWYDLGFVRFSQHRVALGERERASGDGWTKGGGQGSPARWKWLPLQAIGLRQLQSTYRSHSRILDWLALFRSGPPPCRNGMQAP